MMKKRNRKEEFVTGFRKLMLVYWKDFWLILLSGAVLAAAMLIFTKLAITPLYQATATLFVNSVKSGTASESGAGTGYSSQQMLDTCISIIGSERVLSRAIQELNIEDLTTDGLRERFTATQDGTTDIFRIVVTYPNAEAAARICNALVRVGPEVIAEVVEGSSAQVIDYASVPLTRYSPSYLRNTLAGAIAGVLAAVIFLTLRFLLDVRIQDEEDLSQLFSIPVLGQIPIFTAPGKQYSGYGHEARESGGTE